MKKANPTTPGVRHKLDNESVTASVRPHKKLRSPLPKTAGRNVHGKVTARHRGGRQKRYFRKVDTRRDKLGIEGVVNTIEYDPNRSANIALITYKDGEKRYILAPVGLVAGDTVQAGEQAPLKPGNALPLSKVPVGTPVHNVELKPGHGGQMAKGAGTAAFVQAKEADVVTLKLPSGEIRLINPTCFATIGQVSNPDHKNRKLGKAGRKRLMGWRPKVRGVAQHPDSHPHGGGEGRSGIGMPSPKSPWGKKTLGKKTRKKKKYSDRYRVNR